VGSQVLGQRFLIRCIEFERPQILETVCGDDFGCCIGP
jgi:hypothetical protein